MVNRTFYWTAILQRSIVLKIHEDIKLPQCHKVSLFQSFMKWYFKKRKKKDILCFLFSDIYGRRNYEQASVNYAAVITPSFYFRSPSVEDNLPFSSIRSLWSDVNSSPPNELSFSRMHKKTCSWKCYDTVRKIRLKKKKGRHEQNGSVIRDVFYVKYVILLQTRLTQLWHNVPLRELKWS